MGLATVAEVNGSTVSSVYGIIQVALRTSVMCANLCHVPSVAVSSCVATSNY